MLIKCLRIREGGTKAEIDGTEYKFLPDARFAGAPHLCAVELPAHIKKFLALDAYEPFDSDAVAKNDSPAKAPKAPAQSTDTAPASGTETQAPAAASETDQNTAPPVIDQTPPASTVNKEALGRIAYKDRAVEDLSDEELRAAFLDLFSKNAHPKTSREKLIENITNKLTAA